MQQVLEFLSNYKLYISLGLYILILLPIILDFLFGLLKGFRRALWKLIIRTAYLLIFILTLNLMADFLFNVNLFGLPKVIEQAITGTANPTTITFKDLSHSLQNYYLSEMGNDIDLDAPYFVALIDSLVRYGIKIIWAILYFLIIAPICRIILRLTIFNIFIKGRKEFRKINNDRFLGGLLGALNGLTKAFVIMIGLSGLFSLIAYNGQAQDIIDAPLSEASIERENSVIGVSLDENDGVYYLSDAPSNPLGDVDVSEAIDNVIDMMKMTTEIWETNKVVELANSIYFKEEIGKDDEGKPVYEKEGILNKCFDEIIYLKYSYEDSEDENKNIEMKVNFVTDLNNILQSVLYVIDNSEALGDDGSIDFSKLDSAKIESSFTHLSNVKLFKVGIVVGSNIMIEQFSEDNDSFLADDDFQNEIYQTDFTQDLSSLGKMVGGMFDLGLGDYINDLRNNDDPEKEFKFQDLLKIFLPDIKNGETKEEYDERTEKGREKVKEGAQNLNILDVGSGIICKFLFKDILKDQVTELGLFDLDLNVTEAEEITYIDKFCKEVNLSRDFGILFDLIYDLADFNANSGKLDYVIDKYKNAVEGDGEVTLDEICELVNEKILPKFSRMSFIQSGMDIIVKIITGSLKDNETLNKYLTENNIFSTYIDWSEEIGQKIPNLVDAIITSDFLATINLKFGDNDEDDNKNLLDKVFERGSVSDLFRDTITALFDLKLISNLEDTCLKPLVTELLEGMSTNGFQIKVGDNIESFGDELILFTELVDDMIRGAKRKGARSFSDLSDNMTYLIAGFTNLDALKLEKSSILGNTIVHLLAESNIEILEVPYSEAEVDENGNSVWFTQFRKNETGDFVLDDDGNKIIESYGEIFKMVAAIKQVDNIDNLLSGNGIVAAIAGLNGDCTDRLSHIHGEDYESWCYVNGESGALKSKVNVLLDSGVLRCTISKFIAGDNLDNGFFKVPENDVEKKIINKTDPDTGASYQTARYYLTEESLVQLFESLLTLLSTTDISSFDNLGLSMVSDILDIDPTDMDKILESDILTITITGFIKDVDVIVIPKTVGTTKVSEDVNTMKINEDGTEIKEPTIRILPSEIKTLIKSLSIIFDDNMDLNSIGMDTFKSLSNLNSEQLNSISSSYILNATLTKLLGNAFGSGATNTIIVPSTALVEYVNKDNLNAYMITGNEVKNLITAIGYFDFENFKSGTGANAFSTFTDLNRKSSIEEGNKTLTQLEVILKSEILHATISNVIMGLSMGSLNVIVPNTAIDNVDVYKLNLETLNYEETEANKVKSIKVSELGKLLESISYIDVNGFTGGDDQFGAIKGFADFISLDKADRKIDKILASDIIRCTISNYILNMHTSAFSISVPSEDVIVVVNEKTGEDTYCLSIEDLEDFIFGISSLNLSQLTSDTIGAILSLSDNSKLYPSTAPRKNIEVILDSDLLLYTLSSYVLDKLDSLGFTSIAIPVTSIDTAHTKFDPENPHVPQEVKFIKAEELEKFVIALRDIDLKNIASDPLNALKAFTEAQFSEAYESEILSTTLSKQLLNFASSGDAWRFIIPKECFELTSGGDIKLYEIYKAGSTPEYERRIKEEDFYDLIVAINQIDINNLTADKLLSMDNERFDTILDSKIFLTNISDKIRAAILGNDNIDDYYLEIQNSLETSDITYSNTVSSTLSTEFTNKSISHTELSRIYSSMKVLSSNDLSSLKLDFQILYNFADDEIDGVRKGYENDDDITKDIDDQRASFLRSDFIRYAINKNLKAYNTASLLNGSGLPPASIAIIESKLPQGYVQYLAEEGITDVNPSVKVITKYFDTKFFSEDKLEATSLDLALSSGNITFSEISTLLAQNKQYRVTIDGKVINHEDGDPTTTYRVGTMLDSVGNHNISVSGTAQTISVDLMNPANSTFKVYKPLRYNTRIETKEGSLNAITNVNIDGQNLTFDKVDNVEKYIIEFYNDADDSLVATKELITTNNVSLKLSTLLKDPGKYYFKIDVVAENTAYLDSGSHYPYSSKGINELSYIVNKNIDTPDSQIIQTEDGQVLYVTDVDDSTLYTITINGNTYTYNKDTDEHSAGLTKVTVSHDEIDYIRYKISINGKYTSPGEHTIDISVSNTNEYYTSANDTVSFYTLDQINTSLIKLSDESDFIEIPVIPNADKYLVQIKQINGANEVSFLYKEITIEEGCEKVLVSTKTLFAGYNYKVYVEPVKTNKYYENTEAVQIVGIIKTLKAPSHNKVSESYIFTFKTIDDAAKYKAYLYQETEVEGEKVYQKVPGCEYEITDTTIEFNVFEMFSTYEFTDYMKYKVTIKAIPEEGSALFLESVESNGAEFIVYPEE